MLPVLGVIQADLAEAGKAAAATHKPCRRKA